MSCKVGPHVADHIGSNAGRNAGGRFLAACLGPIIGRRWSRARGIGRWGDGGGRTLATGRRRRGLDLRRVIRFQVRRWRIVAAAKASPGDGDGKHPHEHKPLPRIEFHGVTRDQDRCCRVLGKGSDRISFRPQGMSRGRLQLF